MKSFLLLIVIAAILTSCTSEKSTDPVEGCGTFTDINGKTYNTVKIGNQCWTLENLSVSRYRNGDLIQQVTDPNVWDTIKTGAWCYYHNDPANEAFYGKLYNWYAVNDPRGLAPLGYHVPSKSEWAALVTCLGGESIAGGKLKETGTLHWKQPNKGATNESGFTALPTNERFGCGTFGNLGESAFYWTSTDSNEIYSWAYYLSYYWSIAGKDYYDKSYGFSIRCVKD